MLSSVVAVVLVFLLLFLLFYQSFVLGLPCLCGGLMLVVQKFLPLISIQSPYDASIPTKETSDKAQLSIICYVRPGDGLNSPGLQD